MCLLIDITAKLNSFRVKLTVSSGSTAADVPVCVASMCPSCLLVRWITEKEKKSLIVCLYLYVEERVTLLPLTILIRHPDELLTVDQSPCFSLLKWLPTTIFARLVVICPSAQTGNQFARYRKPAVMEVLRQLTASLFSDEEINALTSFFFIWR